MAHSPARLFVYGTLRSEFDNRYARQLAIYASLMGRASIRGRLYRLDNFPAMRRSLAEEERVIGELFALHRPVSTLAMLDKYEGMDYSRVVTMAELEGGLSLSAFVYEWRWPLPEWRRIGSGDYLDV